MTPETWIDLIEKDPWSWLWDPQIQTELFPLLPHLWDTIDDKERSTLTNLILAGPPDDQLREDLKPQVREETRDLFVWERLVRLALAKEPLPAKAQTRLDQLETTYPQWKLTGTDRDDFVYWSESGTGYESDMSADELAALPNSELLEALLGGDYYRDGRLSVWEGVVMKDPDRAFSLIEHMLQTRHIDEDILVASFRGLAQSDKLISEMKKVAGKAKELAENMPHDQWGRGIYAFARLVERLTTEAPELSSEVLTLWDIAFKITLSQSVKLEGTDLLNKSINLPVGYLMDALFDRLRKETQPEERKIPESIRKRLEKALQSGEDSEDKTAGLAARVIICSRMSWLYWLDAEWTMSQVVPLLDWENPGEAKGAWQGFLWSPLVEPGLWAAIHPHFLKAFDHYDTLGSIRTKLPEILVYAYVYAYSLKDDAASTSLKKVDENGLQAAAHYLFEMLKGAGEKADRLWQARIGPFYQKVWPKDKSARSPNLTEYIALAAIHSGNAFPTAVDTVSPLLMPHSYPYQVLKVLKEKAHPTNFPEATLKLLEVLVADNAQLKGTELPAILDNLKAEGISLETPVGRRLQDAAQRG